MSASPLQTACKDCIINQIQISLSNNAISKSQRLQLYCSTVVLRTASDEGLKHSCSLVLQVMTSSFCYSHQLPTREKCHTVRAHWPHQPIKNDPRPGTRNERKYNFFILTFREVTTVFLKKNKNAGLLCFGKGGDTCIRRGHCHWNRAWFLSSLWCNAIWEIPHGGRGSWPTLLSISFLQACCLSTEKQNKGLKTSSELLT